MARIDLLDVCKTLRDPHAGSAAGAGRDSAFAIQDLSLRVASPTSTRLCGRSTGST